MLKHWLKTKRGLAAELARRLGVPQVSVSRWGSDLAPIPAHHCPGIEEITGIPAEKLRPDLTWRRVRASGWSNGKPVLDVAKEAA